MTKHTDRQTWVKNNPLCGGKNSGDDRLLGVDVAGTNFSYYTTVHKTYNTLIPLVMMTTIITTSDDCQWWEWTLAMTFSGHDDSTINIVLGLLLLLLLSRRRWRRSIRLHVSEWVSEWVSSCLTAHQHNTGYSVPLMAECQKWFILKATNMVQQIIIMIR